MTQSAPDAAAAIRQILDAQANAWNGADSAAWAAPFTDDADFVNILGQAQGRSAIASLLVETMYAVTHYRFLLPGVQPTSEGVAEARPISSAATFKGASAQASKPSEDFLSQSELAIRVDAVVSAALFSPAIYAKFNPDWKQKMLALASGPPAGMQARVPHSPAMSYPATASNSRYALNVLIIQIFTFAGQRLRICPPCPRSWNSHATAASTSGNVCSHSSL